MLTTLDLRPHALDVLRARYPLKDATGHVIESPEALFRRVAHHVATVEKAYGRDPAAVEDPFFQMMAELEFLGTISIIAGCSTEIEPMYAIAYERHVLDGRTLIEVHPEFERRARPARNAGLHCVSPSRPPTVAPVVNSPT